MARRFRVQARGAARPRILGSLDRPVQHFEVQLVAGGRIDPGRLVTRRVALEETGAVLAAMDDYETLGFTVIDKF
ncbi:MAG: hypothetical protein O7D31_06465 [Alphaproteobacteria bacterium]|nr:hypothetical protein [Alphaproteobacteria bacterium]MCZ6744305.1 hypothetical protein [Alphaproteobacteria bacterium]